MQALISTDMRLTLPSPEVIAQPDPIDNRVFSHNAWVVCYPFPFPSLPNSVQIQF